MTVRIANPTDIPAVYALRFEVFVDEQEVPPEIEIDAEDATALHIIAEDPETPGVAIGCARVLFHGDTIHIGRLAVKKSRRREGVGAAICRFILANCIPASPQSLRICLNAQIQAAGFYQKQGFRPCGDHFMEAGIEHVAMVYCPEEEGSVC